MKHRALAAALAFAAPFLFAVSAPCLAQANACPLKLEEAPEVRGFKLGQAFENAKKDLPPRALAYAEKDELGVRRVDLGSHLMLVRDLEDPANAWAKRFEGIEDVRLKFLDDKLASVEIGYDSTTKWNDPLEFTAAVASALKLPKQGWRGSLPTFLDCEGFTVETYGELHEPRLILKLRHLDGELVTRKYENERKKRERFKP